MKCKCGFEFRGPGEFRNFNCFLTKDDQWIAICGVCGKSYLQMPGGGFLEIEGIDKNERGQA